MDVLQKLADIADKLDAKGLYREANEIDSIIKEAQDSILPPGYMENWVERYKPKSVHNFPEDVINVPYEKHTFEKPTVIRPRKRYLATLNQLRKELGLGPGMFDRDVGVRLNKYFPGVWQPGAKQKASDLLAAVQQRKQQQQAPDTGVAGQEPRSQVPRGAEPPRPVSPPMSDLFPRTTPPDVDLGSKKEYPIDILE